MKKFLLIFAFLLSMVTINAQTYVYNSYAYAQKNAGYVDYVNVSWCYNIIRVN